MKIDRRITNGLAWAGVFVVVGVPAADLLSAQFLGDPAKAPPQVAVVAPVAPMPAPLSQRPDAPEGEVDVAATEAVAPVPAAQPTKPAAATKTADAVDAFLQSGRDLPSYITGGSDGPAPAQVAVTPPATKPNPVTPATTEQAAAPPARPVIETDPVQVAAIPAKVAPVPMPLSMRPTPVVVPAVTTATVPAGRNDIVLPPSVNVPAPPANVTSADLEDWESGPLSEFLAKRQQGGNASAYTGNGFFLDQAPGTRRPQPDRFIGPVDDGFWFVD